MSRIGKVEAAHEHAALHVGVFLAVAVLVLAGQVVRVGVVHRIAHVAAHAQPQSGRGIPVGAGGKAETVGHTELEGRVGTALYPRVAGEVQRIQPCHGLHLVAPRAGASPETDTR